MPDRSRLRGSSHRQYPAGRPYQVVVHGTFVSTGGGAYRWLIRTEGAQPTVAAENQHAGTTRWRLRGPAANVGGVADGDVIGYVAREAVQVGQTERIYVSAPGAPSVRIRIFRMGWYGGKGGREVLVSAPLRVVPQPPCAHSFDTGLTQCAWHPTLTFVVPSALPTGVYVAKLSAHTGQSDCLFVVMAARPQPLLAQLPTSTYEAYNAWGGDSLYPGGVDRVKVTGTTQGVEVSYQRPYASLTGAGQFFARDVAMIRFLERYRYPVSYTTSESVDEDPGQVAGHRAVIDFGHSDYWSERQAAAFANARNQVELVPLPSTSALLDGCKPSAPTPWPGASATPRRREAPAIGARLTRRSSPTSSSRRAIPTGPSPRARSRTEARRSPARHTWAASPPDSGSREPCRDHDLHLPVRRARVQHRHARLGAQPRAGAECLTRRAAAAQSVPRDDDPEPARARPGDATALDHREARVRRAGGSRTADRKPRGL